MPGTVRQAWSQGSPYTTGTPLLLTSKAVDCLCMSRSFRRAPRLVVGDQAAVPGGGEALGAVAVARAAAQHRARHSRLRAPPSGSCG